MTDQLITEDLRRTLIDVCWKATPYGENIEGDIDAYLVPAGALHRLIGAAQGAGVPAAFRNLGGPS